MSVYVVDASVAAKWFIRELHAAAAFAVLDRGNQLHVPDFFFLEMDSAICKWIRRGVITKVEGDGARTTLDRALMRKYPFSDLRDSAYALANQTGCTLYDCLYVSLAVLLGCQLVTADRRLYDGLSQGPFAKYVLWVEDVP